ncbi:MAG: DAK2 domain-containing protein [Corynebacterium sp.]|uniref:DAK2 domain-containing protein n=1 Tax=Corynebacterium sp. TaxID=1720 RepID=UPI0026E075AD|nr:DAK2 domain-containing protein [Corynebacterium sp.]MDO5668981.1 DAK2 domain-containing protein [Corynebacterium sp.]
MPYPRELDGPRLHTWAARAVAELSARRAEINALNVFPVPDADTGSNMTHTMEAALKEADKLPAGTGAPEVAAALASGSVRGARGNSGLVLSQVLRAVADSAARGPIDAASIARSLTLAVSLVDRAIAEPVEGTVITVLRAAAGAAESAEGDLHAVVSAAFSAARTALAKTPSQLDVLREAGVVDAGGAGFVVLLETLIAEIEGTQVQAQVDITPNGPAPELEVTFFFHGDLDQLQSLLGPLGDSLVIARADDTSGRVHIHSRDAGRVIETAFGAGAVTDLRLEVLPDAPQVEAPRRVVVAVTPPGSVAELYREAGAVVVTPGDNVVTEILAQVRTSRAQELILLPNGLLDRRQLVSVERSTHAFEQTFTIVPTSRLVTGIAALSVHDPEAPIGVAAYTMTEAATAMRTDIICDATGSIEDATEAACRNLLSAGGEHVILLTGTELDVDKLDAALDVDVMSFPADGLGHLVEIGVE